MPDFVASQTNKAPMVPYLQAARGCPGPDGDDTVMMQCHLSPVVLWSGSGLDPSRSQDSGCALQPLDLLKVGDSCWSEKRHVAS